jgi:hypothetical protein
VHLDRDERCVEPGEAARQDNGKGHL